MSQALQGPHCAAAGTRLRAQARGSAVANDVLLAFAAGEDWVDRLATETDKVFDITEEMDCEEVLQLCCKANRASSGVYEYKASQEIY